MRLYIGHPSCAPLTARLGVSVFDCCAEMAAGRVIAASVKAHLIERVVIDDLLRRYAMLAALHLPPSARAETLDE